MAHRKPGLTYERHVEIGEALNRMQSMLTHLQCEIGNAYPVSGKRGRAYVNIIKALKFVGITRCCLEDNLYDDHPDKANTKIYYGGALAADLTDSESGV